MFLIIIVAILIFSLILFVHEFGHFVFAKRSGIFVEEFGFGYAPRFFGIQKYPGKFKFKFFFLNKIPQDEDLKHSTIYSLNFIPFGAFVKILGEEKSDSDLQSYNNQRWLIRFLVIFGSTIAHFTVAFLALVIAFRIGLPMAISDDETEINFKNPKIQIIEVVKKSPADIMGIKVGDIILELKNESVIKPARIDEIQSFIQKNKGKNISVKIQRGIKELILSGNVREISPSGEGLLGIGLTRTGVVSYTLPESIWNGFKSVFKIFWMMILFLTSALWSLIRGIKPSGVELTGPVGIINLTANIAGLGINYVFQFFAIINLNLALINLLPIPALDGGKMLFLFIEKIIGKKINEKTEYLVHSVGFAILLAIMVLITYKDIIKLF